MHTIIHKLKLLNADGNEFITTVNHLKDLEILYAFCKCGINDLGIMGYLKLKQLDAIPKSKNNKRKSFSKFRRIKSSYNHKITNCNHLKDLKILCADGNSGISDDDIIGCKKIENICITCNYKINRNNFNIIYFNTTDDLWKST